MVKDVQGSFSSSLCTECMIILMAMVQSYSPTRSTVVRLPAIVYLMSRMVNPIPTFRSPHTLRLHLCLDPLHLPISCYEHLVVVRVVNAVVATASAADAKLAHLIQYYAVY